MKRSTLAAIGGSVAGIAGGMAASVIAMRKRVSVVRPDLTHLSADQVSYVDIISGATRGVLWGDPMRGAYAAFTRFAPDQYFPMHTHPNDVSMVVLSGAYIYEADGKQIRVGPREYLFIPKDSPHVSRSDPNEGCLFFETSDDAFGLKLLD